MPRPGHVSRWPAFPPKPSTRRLAYMDDGLIVSPEGEIIGRPFGWAEYLDQTTAGASYMMLTDDLGSSPWVAEALEHPEWATVDCTKTGHVLQVRARGHKNRKSVLLDRSAWDKKLAPPELLRELVRLYEHHQSGPQTTPGALGGYSMARSYLEARNTFRSRPSAFLRHRLLDNAVGGLVDTAGRGRKFPVLWEIDRRSAYAAEARQPLPVGTAVRLAPPNDGPHAWEYPLWYCACLVRITERLPLPLIGAPTGRGMVYRPTSAGWYGGSGSIPLWLWSVEAEALHDRGWADVRPLWGWAWRHQAPVLADWSEHIWRLRNTAPSDQIAAWTKQSIVAGVGRLGMRPKRYKLAMAKHHPEGKPVTRQQWPPISDYVVIEEADPESPAPVDWHSLIVARARVTLWQRAIDELLLGANVYAMDHDSIVMDRPSAFEIKPTELGEWKQTELHRVFLPEARQLVSNEVVRLPGVPIGTRELDHFEVDN